MTSTCRVLHVVGRMQRAGVETWIMQLLRRIPRRRCAIDILVHAAEPGEYDDEIRALGARLTVFPRHRQPAAYVAGLLRLLHRDGPYTAVHSHVHRFSGLVLTTARLADVPRRIAHAHIGGADAGASPLRRVYLGLQGVLLASSLTRGIAVSGIAGDDLFPAGWRDDPRLLILPCGIDLDRIARAKPRLEARRLLGLPADAFVIGHVGRLEAQKNHRFLVEVAAQAARVRRDTVLLLVGDGALRGSIEAQAAGLGVPLLITGSRPDVPDLLSAMDRFCFPSHYEGMPLALVEAQASGLPVLASDTVTAEAVAVPAYCRRLPLAAGATVWAETLLEQPTGDRHAALTHLRGSSLDIDRGVTTLLDLYGASL